MAAIRARTIELLALLLPLFSAAALAQAGSNPPVNHESAIASDFEKRVAEYMKVHQKAQTGLTPPKNTDSAQQIAEFQHELASRIRALRPDAKQGDIFTPECAGLFRRLVRSALDSPDGEKIRKSYERAEPLHGFHLNVNEAYPDGVPLQSMPPSLLLNLPPLPKDLEYRFVGHELVLHDVAADLIVDLVPDLTNPESQ
jgi:hypothetical protein